MTSSLTPALFSVVLICSCCKPAEFPSSPDRAFATAAATANIDGMATGNLGAQYASGPAIRTFSSLLAGNDSAAELALLPMADSINLVLPTAPDGEYDSLRQQVSGEPTGGFDLQWLRTQSTALHRLTSLYEKEIGNGQSGTVQRYARNWLPAILRQQLEADSLLNLQPAQ